MSPTRQRPPERPDDILAAGVHTSQPFSPSHQLYGDMPRPPTPYRVASLDLTSTRDAYNSYDDETELRELP
jgi:hypothetical protein